MGGRLNALAYEIMGFAAFKTACTLQGFTGKSLLPLPFVRVAFALARKQEPTKPKSYTVNSFCADFFSLTHERVVRKTGVEYWFDNLKFNALPPSISAVDCCLQPLFRKRNLPAAMLSFAVTRRMLNESSHLEYALRKHGLAV